MATLATNVAGIPIFTNDAPPVALYNVVGAMTVATLAAPGIHYPVDATTGEPRLEDDSADMPQPIDRTRIDFLVAYTSQMAAARAAVIAAAAALPAARPINFGRTPARVNRDVIDYETKEGAALYRDGAKSLFRDTEETFGLSSANLHSFLNKVEHRKTAKGWDIFMIPDAVAVAGGVGVVAVVPVDRNLLTHHGQLTKENIIARVIDMGINSRELQEDAQLFECLWTSISTSAQGTLSLKDDDYKVHGEGSGLCFLYSIIQESTITTKSTTNHMWSKLTSGMPDILAGHGNNIVKFNEEIRLVQKQLVARGEDPTNILPQLFTTYKGCESVESSFGRFMENLEFAHDQGTKALSVNILMSEVETKYKTLVEQQKFKSGSGKPKDDFVALQAGFKAQIDSLTAQVSSFGGRQSGGNEGGGGGGGGTQADRKPKPSFKELITPPKEGESLLKMIKGKPYRWCATGEHRPKWVRHAKCECGKAPGTATNAPKGDKERDAALKHDGAGVMGATAPTGTSTGGQGGNEGDQPVPWSTALMASMYGESDEE